ncbi:MAG TPA: class I SAM-dependent methyltransferase [Polyangia bacterium]|jgi:2-polyprenyl-3-methyl-5-hydroxy-6-metoxy-1,4-benzoquinol methylase
MAACPACRAEEVVSIFERLAVPVNQNVPLPTRAAALAMPRGDISLCHCRRCGLTFNASFDPHELRYDESYENSQMSSPSFEAHVDALVGSLVAAGVRSKRVLEIGCGKGDFLARLCRAGDNRGIGYDTTYEGPATAADGRAQFVRAYYDGSSLPFDVDVVICRHVIEHVADPVALAGSVRSVLAASGGEAFFETPALEWILEGAVFWDIFYEHACYFSRVALENVFRLASFAPSSTTPVFSGQYYWLRARPTATAPTLAGDDSLERLQSFARAQREKVARWRARIAGADKGWAVWGAGAKGVTFVNELDADAKLIRYLVDVNPAKHGRFVPGSGHEIRPPAALADGTVGEVILMNPNYAAECRQMLAALNASVTLTIAE